MIPDSYESVPDGFLQNVFDKITANEIKAPVTRNLVQGAYEHAHFDSDISFRLHKSSKDSNRNLTESEFFNTAELTHPQLFEISNRLDTEFFPQSLQSSALKYLVNLLTAKFCQICQHGG